MSSDIIINSTPYEIRAALVENNQLVELFIERAYNRGIAGNIYKGKVVRVLPGMQAAFVDIGLDRAAFLYVRDVYEDFDDLRMEDIRDVFNKEDVPIQDMLREGQEVLVQVSKEPIGMKGAQVTSHISLPGKYMVLLPTAPNKVGISRRIESEKKRTKLRKIVEKISAGINAGFIVRTASDDRKEKDLQTDLDYLLITWDEIQNRKQNARAPVLIHSELPLAMRAVRDMFTDDIDRFIIDDEKLYEDVQNFLERLMPQLKPALQLYEYNEPIFEHYGIEMEISKALDRKVWLKSGGSIIIDQTEALTAIDVNTGRYVGKRNFDDTILKTNLEAVREVVYQLRLRNIGGLIIIDFIDMERRVDQEKVFNALEKALRADNTKSTILKISELGLVEMTRKRVRENLTRTMCESCSYCEGRGHIKSTISVCYEIFRELSKETYRQKGKEVLLYVHPDIAELLYQSEQKEIERIEKEHGVKVLIEEDSNFHQEQYEISLK